jgi:flagellar biosynthetic protein FlhB
VPSPPLARALWQVELDAEIPAEHYQAVAEIIASGACALGKNN